MERFRLLADNSGPVCSCSKQKCFYFKNDITCVSLGCDTLAFFFVDRLLATGCCVRLLSYWINYVQNGMRGVFDSYADENVRECIN